MSIKLKEFITGLRACKTAQAERTYVCREIAAIRASFNDETTVYRHRNVAKLLFISMLGHSIQFAQMECLKLISSSSFLEKKIGYLALSAIFDEASELLMLATNSIKNDLTNTNQYINAAALVALANVGSPEMGRELFREVDEFMNVSNPALKKKTLFCVARLAKVVPDLDVRLCDKVGRLLEDRNHGVLLGTVAMMSSMLVTNPKSHGPSLSRHITTICRIMRDLIQSSPINSLHSFSFNDSRNLYQPTGMISASPEHDIGGVNDPILQVQLLQFLRNMIKLFPQGILSDNENWTVVSSLLALVLVPCDNVKHASLCVIFEALRIMALIVTPSSRLVMVGSSQKLPTKAPIVDVLEDSPLSQSRVSTPPSPSSICAPALPGLSELKTQTLGWLDKFLINKDNTVRYVGLSILSHIVKVDEDLASKHRSTVISCLHDPDITIQKRAAKLAIALTNPSNAPSIVCELLNVMLVLSDPVPLMKPSPGAAISSNTPARIVTSPGQVDSASTLPTNNNSSISDSLGTSTYQIQAKKELISDIVQMIAECTDHYAPTRLWQLDNLIRLACLAGNSVPLSLKASLSTLMLVSPPHFQLVAIYKLFSAVCSNILQTNLVEIGVWTFGEFSYLISPDLDASNLTENLPELGDKGGDKGGDKLSIDNILDLFQRILHFYGLEKPHTFELSNSFEPGGIVKPISTSCIKMPLDSNIHFVEAKVLREYPACFLPSATADAISNSRLPEIISTALLKIARWSPSHKKRCQTFIEQILHSSQFPLVNDTLEGFLVLLNSPNWANMKQNIITKSTVVENATTETVRARPLGNVCIQLSASGMDIPKIPETPERVGTTSSEEESTSTGKKPVKAVSLLGDFDSSPMEETEKKVLPKETSSNADVLSSNLFAFSEGTSSADIKLSPSVQTVNKGAARDDLLSDLLGDFTNSLDL